MDSSIDPALERELLALIPDGYGELSLLADSHNLVLRATGGGPDLVVRLQPVERISDAKAHALVEFLAALSNEPGVRAPQPVRLRSGEWFATLSGRRVACVTFVAGERARNAKAFVEPDRLHAIGATVAHMHACARNISEPHIGSIPHFAKVFEPGSGLLSDAFRRDLPAPLRDPMERAQEFMADALRSHSGPGESGLIHADLEPQNWVFAEGRPGPIDFDELHYGPYALDLIGVLWTHALWPDYPAYREELFEGYQRVHPLPPRTRKNADALAAITFAVWFDFIYRQPESERAQHLEFIGRMAEQVVRWCGVA